MFHKNTKGSLNSDKNHNNNNEYYQQLLQIMDGGEVLIVIDNENSFARKYALAYGFGSLNN